MKEHIKKYPMKTERLVSIPNGIFNFYMFDGRHVLGCPPSSFLVTTRIITITGRKETQAIDSNLMVKSSEHIYIYKYDSITHAIDLELLNPSQGCQSHPFKVNKKCHDPGD